MFKAVSFYITADYIRVFLQALFVFLLAREVDEDFYGKIGLAQTAILITSICALKSIDNIIQREVVANRKAQEQIYGTALFLKLSISIIGILIYLIWLYFEGSYDYTFKIYLLAFSLIIPFIAIGSLVSLVVARNDYRVYFISIAIPCLLTFLIKTSILYLTTDYSYIIFAITFEYIFCGLVIYYVYRVHYSLDFIFSKEYCRKFMREGSWLVLSAITYVLYANIDVFFIKEMINTVAVANYLIALKIILVFVLAASALISVFVHRLNKESPKYKQIAKEMFQVSILLSLLFTVVAYFFIPLFLQIVFENKFEHAKEIIVYMLPLIPLHFLLITTGRILVVEKLSRVLLQRNFFALIINVILNYYFIMAFSLVGAVYASIASYLFSSLLYLLIHNHSRRALLAIAFSK